MAGASPSFWLDATQTTVYPDIRHHREKSRYADQQSLLPFKRIEKLAYRPAIIKYQRREKLK
jgi:hypothetical protein